jgi:hypothetical protein
MTPRRRHRGPAARPASARTPRLWPLQLLIPLAVVLALVAAAGAYWFVTVWLFGQPLRPRPADPDQQRAAVEVAKAALGVAAAAGAVAAIVVGYRRTRLDHAQSLRDDNRLFTERFGAAAEHLGGDDARIRVAGVYALGQLADDWDEQRQTCVDLLCAYLRMPYDPVPQDRAEREVRDTVFRVLKARLTDPGTPHSWCDLDFDFSNATLDGGGLHGAHFTGRYLFFNGARFTSGHIDLRSVRFAARRVDFSDATFERGCVVDFGEATFTSQDLRFRSTVFAGRADFRAADFTGATPDFAAAVFPGGTRTSFRGATMTRTSAGTLPRVLEDHVTVLDPSQERLPPPTARPPAGR